MGANSSSLGRICNINASRSTGDNVIGTNNLPPITFHPTHGENVRLLRNGAVARRAESFCKGVTFSNRPVKINERVYLRFAEISTSWSGVLRFGFTSVDPSSLRGSLPKYVCPDFTNKPGYWAKALAERYAERDAVLFYYVTQNGDVHFGVNGEEKGVFFNGVDTRSPLWALIDIYGNTIAMEFLENRTQLNNANPPPAVTNNAERVSSLVNISVDANADPTVVHNSSARFETLRFHHTCGCNIQLSNDKTIATRPDTEFNRGYVFTRTPLRPREKIVIQVLVTDPTYIGSLAFGLTACNPSTISAAELPEDSDSLLDRPEYWVVHKDVANNPHRGEELGFAVSADGEVLFYKNDLPPITIMHVDQTQQLWAFFDLFGSTLKIKMLGSTWENNAAYQVGAEQGQSPLQVILPPATTPTSNLNTDKSWPFGVDTADGSFIAGLDGVQDNATNECSICYEHAVDSVLYTCGHMCMCYDCAIQLWQRPAGGQCPICRAEIRDVIRTYRS